MHRFHQSTHLETKPFHLFVFQTSSFFAGFLVYILRLLSSASMAPPAFQTTVFGYTSGIKNKRVANAGTRYCGRSQNKESRPPPQSISCSETNGNFVWVSRNANPIPYTQGVGIISGVMLPSCDAFRVIDLAL